MRVGRDVGVDLAKVDRLGLEERGELVLDEVALALESLARCFEEEERLEYMHAVLEDLVLDRDARERSLVGEEGDLVPKHFGVSRLDEEGRDAMEVAEER